MALLTSDVILDEAMERYATQSVIMQLADGRYDPQWGDSQVKGDTIAIRLPIYSRPRRGERADPQAIEERLVNLTIPPAYGSDSLLTDRQLSMELNDFKEQVLEPLIDSVSASVAKAACATMTLGVSQFVGIPGQVPTSLDTYQSAHRIMTQSGAPTGLGGVRSMLVDANMDQYAAAAGRTFLNPTAEISERYRTGSMAGKIGDFGGATWFMEQALYQQTIGALSTNQIQVNGANQSGNTINLKGFVANATGVLNPGDKLQFVGAGMVHPVLGTIYNDLAAFTVAQVVNADGSGHAAVLLTEQIEFGTPYANVSALPADSANVLVWGQTLASSPGYAGIANVTFTTGMLMHKSALVYGSPDLPLPKDVDELSGRTRSKMMKLGMRVWRASDVMSGERVTRLDILVGHLVGQPRKACLICSA